MKKLFLLTLAVLLVLSLAACGDKDNGGNNDPLNRPGNTSGTSQNGDNNPGDIPNLADAIGGTGKLSDLSPAQRQALIDQARADGVEIEFKSDGSVIITEADGSKSIQKPDGNWTFEDADGNKHDVQIGGGWPDNEFTKLLPKPEFTSLNGANTTDEGFSVSFSDATLEKVKAYAEQLKAKGFTVDEETIDEKYDDVVVYNYSASNADGYHVVITFSDGQSLLSIMKP